MGIKRREAFLRRTHIGRGLALKRKKGPTAMARARKSAGLRAKERANKDKARARDGNKCRFPLCGCQRGWQVEPMKRALTVSHDFHKGMGGDPTGILSMPEFLVTLCRWRHQDAPVSRHAGTLRSKYMTPDENDGPIAFEIDLAALYPMLFPKGTWLEVGREEYDDEGGGWHLGPLSDRQREVLEDLAEMSR